MDTESLPVDAECGCIIRDSTVSEVNCVQRSSSDSSIKNDSKCYSKKISYSNGGAKTNLNDLHDSKQDKNDLIGYDKDNNDLSDKKEKSCSQNKKNHSNSKENYTAINYSRDQNAIKRSLLENTQKSVDCDDCQILSNNNALDLKSINLPPKLKKRGRPKGADLTVIGLPRKKKCNGKPLKFLRKPRQERDKQILSWILPDKLVKKALLGEKIGKKEAIGGIEPTTNLLDENVNWASVQRFFTKAAWGKVSDMIAELEKNPQWKCGACHKDLSTAASIICESCLVWYHLKCSGLTVSPKKVEWFCRLCYASCSTYTMLHNGNHRIEVIFCLYYKHYVDSHFFVSCRIFHQNHNPMSMSDQREGAANENW